jgi:hypothetical protein
MLKGINITLIIINMVGLFTTEGSNQIICLGALVANFFALAFLEFRESLGNREGEK